VRLSPKRRAYALIGAELRPAEKCGQKDGCEGEMRFAHETNFVETGAACNELLFKMPGGLARIAPRLVLFSFRSYLDRRLVASVRSASALPGRSGRSRRLLGADLIISSRVPFSPACSGTSIRLAEARLAGSRSPRCCRFRFRRRHHLVQCAPGKRIPSTGNSRRTWMRSCVGGSLGRAAAPALHPHAHVAILEIP